jgi:acetyl-CoA C-acetyltransferase
MNTPIFIRAAKRTPFGAYRGALAGVAAPALAATVIRALPDATSATEVVLGQVLSAGCGQAPARQAALGAGLPESTACSLINKVCGSGMEAILSAARKIAIGDARHIIAGGMENMSRAPHLLPDSRGGLPLGEARLIDSLVHDGLRDPYNQLHMGQCAERCASTHAFSREAQDDYAVLSYRRAQEAIASCAFGEEVVAVTVPGRKGDTVVTTDEGPGRADFAKIPTLLPVFEKNGTITAANASSINDGAAGLLLSADPGDTPLARIVAHGSHSMAPVDFPAAPIPAIRQALDRAGWSAADVDLWEINEAFAVVPMLAEKELGIGRDCLNIHGGAIALGHPIGASGARIVVTLVHALRRRGLRRGVAAVCIGGGEGLAICVEREA